MQPILPAVTAGAPARGRSFYALVWRLHFYAGLFCIPFLLWLSLTGPLYLFKPQIDAWEDRPYDRLAIDGPLAAPSAQVQAALDAVPGAVLNAYELMKSMIDAGAAGVHFEDQLASVKKCGHMGGKVLVPTREAVEKLNAARLAADVSGTATLVKPHRSNWLC